jgi:hypothetical protein
MTQDQLFWLFPHTFMSPALGMIDSHWAAIVRQQLFCPYQTLFGSEQAMFTYIQREVREIRPWWSPKPY